LAEPETQIPQGMQVPRARIEALTDGVFGFALTLLVTTLVLPAGFEPKSNREVIDTLLSLDGSVLAYLISFFMIGLRWMGQARVKVDPEMGSGIYLWAVLLQLMFIAVLPFSTMLIGRWDAQFPASIWVYSGNVALAALAAIAVSVTGERLTGQRPAVETGRFSLLVLVATAILSVVISFWSTRWALGVYAINLFTQFFQRWAGRLL
jgi:uncharacterized membrane protein